MKVTKEEQRRILDMDIFTFVEDNIQDAGTKTRLINGLNKHATQPVEKVKDLWFKRNGRLPLHPLLCYRNIGRKCEIEFVSVLEKYDLYFGHPIDNIVNEIVEKPAKRLKFIDYDTSIELASWNGWRSEIPQVGDLVCFPNCDSDNIVWIIKQRCFYKNGLIVFDCVEPN